MKGSLTYSDLAPLLDWRLFAAVCGVKSGPGMTPEAAEALESFKSEAIEYLSRAAVPSSAATAGVAFAASAGVPSSAASAEAVRAEFSVRFFLCRRRDDVIVSDDGTLRLPMLRQGSGDRRSLCDLFPAEASAAPVPLGLFAIKVDAPDGESNPLIAHAARVALAEAASEHLRRRFESESGQRTFMPAVGYPCCPDHSLKRDILQRLDAGISLTDSCAMIPEASICGLVISSDDFRLFEIRDTRADELSEYVGSRGFSDTEKRLYLYSLLP